MSESFFKKLYVLRSTALLKKRFQHRFFPVKFATILQAHCFTEHLQWLLLKVSGFAPPDLLKKRL